MEIRFDRYSDNEMLEAQLRLLAESYPQLCRLSELGRSHEGRPVWLMTVTNEATGPHDEKPAQWMDGNIHATEVTASMACLYTINYLLTNHAHDERVKRLLDEATFYIAPRLNPDGAAQAFLHPPHRVRSGTRPYPYADKRDGLHEEDVDGDGRILSIRVEDPSGDWRISSEDPRLMVKRAPDEHGGTYYRLLPEGFVHNYEPGLIPIAPNLEGLDFNRNFPFEWAPEADQAGAGPYPLSEPETRFAVEFVAGHPNINGAITCHTSGGVLLRSYSTKPDDQMPPEDLWVFQRLGKRGTEITDYPNVSTFHDFRYHPNHLTYGAFDDWCYDHLGIFAWTVELWDVLAHAGIKDRKFIEWYRDHPVEDDLKILQWTDENCGGEAFVPWRPFDHPQLGRVDIGGWDDLFVWSNPPAHLLEPEVAKVNGFVLAQASAAAHLEIRSLEATGLAGGYTKIEAILENSGYLPTYTSLRGQDRKAVKPITVDLELPEEAALVQGKQQTEVGQLEGRSNKFIVGGLGASPTDNRTRLEWVVRARPGQHIGITARSDRAGTARKAVVVGEQQLATG